MRGLNVHRENDHLKEKWRRYKFLIHSSLKECALALREPNFLLNYVYLTLDKLQELHVANSTK